MVRRRGGGINGADPICENENAFRAKPPQDRAAGPLTEEGGRDTRFRGQRITERAGEFLNQFTAVDGGDIADHFI